MKSYERQSLNAIAKQVRLSPNYNGKGFESPKDMVMPCRYCGTNQVFGGYANGGQVVKWECHGWMNGKPCPNNMDYKMKDELTAKWMLTHGNTDRMFVPFKVRHIA